MATKEKLELAREISAQGNGKQQAAPGSWLAIDWREHLREIEIDGSRVNYVDVGKGDAIVFVHGLGGSWQNWLENIPHFVKRYRVIALDLPGFGQSTMPSKPITMPGYAGIVEELSARLELGPVRLVGNSMGGLISLEIAASYPERVTHLTVVSSAGITSASVRPGPVMAAARAIHAGGRLVSRMAEQAVRRPGLRKLTLRGVVHRPDLLRPELIYEQLQGGVHKPGFLHATRAVLGHDIRPRLPKIEAPTLIVWGKKDRLHPHWDSHVLERLIPGARTVVYDDAAHMAHLERAEEFNELLDEFHAGDPD